MTAATAGATASRLLMVLDFGAKLVPFTQALKLQELLHSERHAGSREDTLVLLQHHPVFTIGKRGKEADFKVPLQDIAGRGVEVCHVPRGGEVTFHGPGQLVAYPIIDIRAAGLGARAFVESLEDSVISAIGAYGIRGEGRLKGATGVWVADRKIAAIGVKISYGVSSHGLALNVSTDLSLFDLIVPCGIADKDVTSVARELRKRRAAAAAGDGGGTETHPAAPGAELQRRSAEEVLGRAGAASHIPGRHQQQQQQATGVVQDEAAQLYEAAKGHFLSAFCRRFAYDEVQVEAGVELETLLTGGLPAGRVQ